MVNMEFEDLLYKGSRDLLQLNLGYDFVSKS
jgi:hypothetical protein